MASQVLPWFDDEVKRTLREKEVAFNRRKRNKTPNSEREFKVKRKRFEEASSIKYFSYIKGMISDFTSNPKQFWTFLNRLVNDGVERANLLNCAFANKFSDSEVHDYPKAPVYD